VVLCRVLSFFVVRVLSCRFRCCPGWSFLFSSEFLCYNGSIFLDGMCYGTIFLDYSVLFRCGLNLLVLVGWWSFVFVRVVLLGALGVAWVLPRVSSSAFAAGWWRILCAVGCCISWWFRLLLL